MKFKTKIIPYTLTLKRPAGTSRGTYHNHRIWYVIVSSPNSPNRWGIGECAPLPDLSCDWSEDYELVLQRFCADLENTGELDMEKLKPYPSILFGLETALRHYNRQTFQLWDTAFSRNEEGIPINGLIWMGDPSFMKEQIDAKLKAGFDCIKLKIGAIDFDEELKLLEGIRKSFSKEQITLRVDANGAFNVEEALEKLKRLSEFDIHSIEQPIRVGQWDEMADLCGKTPIPIALDEELIGIHDQETKLSLLQTVQPQYIILKPSLHGGISGSTEWIELAESMNIGWWITSALESNVGLNTIAQWCATLNNPLPQGLGTGGLYTNNVELPLEVRGDHLWFNPKGSSFTLNELK